MSESEESSSSPWRFSMELLSHVHTLRVFLLPCSPQLKPDRDCASLEATLLSAPPALSCTWEVAHQASCHSLRLPLPLLLFDYSAPPRLSALPDSIQLSVTLLSLAPSHLHAFSSLSLTHDGICAHIPDDIPRIHCDSLHGDDDMHGNTDTGHRHGQDGTDENKHVVVPADNGFHDYDDAHEGHEHDGMHVAISAHDGFHDYDDAQESHEHDGTQDIGHVAIPADNVVHGGGDACQNQEHGCIHEIGCLADSSFRSDSGARQRHDHDGTVAIFASNICGCHHHATAHESANVGNDTRRVCQHTVHADDSICSPKQPSNGPSMCLQHHEDETVHIKANVHPTHHKSCSSMHDEGGAFKGSLQCEHGRNMEHLSNKGSCPTDYNSSTHEGFEDHPPEGAAIFLCKGCLVKVSKNPVRNLVQLPCFDWRDIVENWYGACCCSFGSTAEVLSTNFEKSLALRPGKCLVGTSTFYVDFSDVIVDTESALLSTDSNIRQRSTLRFLALGNGFMVWEDQHSKSFNWLPVYCPSCASLIGAYPCKTADSGSVREGLHLFRCQITTFNADGTLYGTHRYTTFKELLVKELQLRTDENSSYRFLIRSLSSQLPLLQLVVLSYDSFMCMGRVTADILDLGEHPQSIGKATGLVDEVGLRQSMKVLFSDCTRLSADEIRDYA